MPRTSFPPALRLAEKALREFSCQWLSGLQPQLSLETNRNGDVLISLKVVAANNYSHQPNYQQHGEHAAEAPNQEGHGCCPSQHQVGPVRDRNSPSRRRRRARREAIRLSVAEASQVVSRNKDHKNSANALVIEEKKVNEAFACESVDAESALKDISDTEVIEHASQDEGAETSTINKGNIDDKVDININSEIEKLKADKLVLKDEIKKKTTRLFRLEVEISDLKFKSIKSWQKLSVQKVANYDIQPQLAPSKPKPKLTVALTSNTCDTPACQQRRRPCHDVNPRSQLYFDHM